MMANCYHLEHRDMIVEALECCLNQNHTKPACDKCPLHPVLQCTEKLNTDALGLITALSELVKTYKAERDAAINDLVDLATSGGANPAPFCKNACEACQPRPGYCDASLSACRGFAWNGRSEESGEQVGDAADQETEESKAYTRLHKAFALACHLLDDQEGKRIQEQLLERVDRERVCRVCGSTEDDACPGVAFWVERDLCLGCAPKFEGETKDA